MPRKAFIADVASAALQHVARVSSVKRGDDDGDVNFTFTPEGGPPFDVGLLVLGESTLEDPEQH